MKNVAISQKQIMSSLSFNIYVLDRAHWESKGGIDNPPGVPEYGVAIEFPEKISVSATLHQMSDGARVPAGDQSFAVALFLDLLREGWKDLCQRIEQPMVKGNALLRGFVLKRTSRLTPGTDWRLSVLIGCELGANFNWQDATDLLDGFRGELLNEVR